MDGLLAIDKGVSALSKVPIELNLCLGVVHNCHQFHECTKCMLGGRGTSSGYGS